LPADLRHTGNAGAISGTPDYRIGQRSALDRSPQQTATAAPSLGRFRARARLLSLIRTRRRRRAFVSTAPFMSRDRCVLKVSVRMDSIGRWKNGSSAR